MLRITRRAGDKVIIGDDSVVTVLSADDGTTELGFDSMHRVRRADNVPLKKKATEIEIAASRSTRGNNPPMLELDIYFAEDVDTGLKTITLSEQVVDDLTEASDSVDVDVVTESAHLNENDPSLFLIRVQTRLEADAIKRATVALNPTIQHRTLIQHPEDGMFYMLFAQRDTVGPPRIIRQDLAGG